jgi:hypothetical protein
MNRLTWNIAPAPGSHLLDLRQSHNNKSSPTMPNWQIPCTNTQVDRYPKSSSRGKTDNCLLSRHYRERNIPRIQELSARCSSMCRLSKKWRSFRRFRTFQNCCLRISSNSPNPLEAGHRPKTYRSNCRNNIVRSIQCRYQNISQYTQKLVSTTTTYEYLKPKDPHEFMQSLLVRVLLE